MNILVVGGTRFFGIPMVEKLLSDGHDVTIATRGLSANPFEKSTKQIVMDRSDYESVNAALSGKSYDVIIDKIAYSSNDVKRLLENVCCKKYIQMSSCAVYFDNKENISEEEFDSRKYPLVWMDRNDDYAEGKRQAERATFEYMDESDCIFVRYPVVMGPNDYTKRLEFYVEHIKHEMPMYVDNLNYGMEFIHEIEAGRFIAHLVNQDIRGAINGSSNGMITAKEIIEIAENAIKKKAVLDRAGDISPYNGTTANLSYDTTKAIQSGFVFSNINDWISELINEI
ncbi:MAG: NAD-dependent epimerase/dehydratase family protein [Lachnospiraceae bacterium]|nr:NAD-dependent epimerase/dehydratase family protein [Lachnospiraceae bacterium]